MIVASFVFETSCVGGAESRGSRLFSGSISSLTEANRTVGELSGLLPPRPDAVVFVSESTIVFVRSCAWLIDDGVVGIG